MLIKDGIKRILSLTYTCDNPMVEFENLKMEFIKPTCGDQMLQWLTATSLTASLADLAVDLAIFKMKVTGFWEYVGSSTTRLSIRGVRAEDLLKASTYHRECTPLFTGLSVSLINHT